MSPNTAIVDDRDPSIAYSSGWNNAGAFLEFQGTTKWASVQGSTATFTFVGSSITVYGSVAANAPQASLSFTVDNPLTGSYSSPQDGSGQYHEALWSSPTMTDGSHTLVITQTSAQSSGVIYLDYLMYDTTSSSVGPYFIDDRDPRIAYTPAWRQFGSEPDFQHTSSESTSPGDSFTFHFEGTAIIYYGGLTTSDTGAAIGSIVLDGGAPVVYTSPDPIPSTTNNIIFKSGTIPAGAHTLVVTSISTHTLWMDYFLVTPNPPSDSSPPVTTTPSSGSTSVPSSAGGSSVIASAGNSHSLSFSSQTSLGTPLSPSPSSHRSGNSTASLVPGESAPLSGFSVPSGAAAASQSSGSSAISLSSTRSTPTGAIAGAVVGALVILALLLTAIVVIRRRRAHARQRIALPTEDSYAVRPFTSLRSGEGYSTGGSADSPTAPSTTSLFGPLRSGNYALESREQEQQHTSATMSTTTDARWVAAPSIRSATSPSLMGNDDSPPLYLA